MISFLYYLTGLSERPTPAEIQRRGLSYALAAESVTPAPVSTGPDGQAGTIVAIGAASNKVGFYAHEQTWRKVSERVWVGMSTIDPMPGPKELARSNQVGGHDLTLGDGRVWLAPAARVWIEEGGDPRHRSRLPARSKLGEGGRWERGAVLPQYAELQAIATRWWDCRMAAKEDEAFSVADAPNQATTVLATNYRIGPVEADLIGIWTDESILAVLDATIDAQGFAEILKKKVGAAS